MGVSNLNILDLLDKPEMTQVHIVQQLLDNGGEMNVKELEKQVKVSSASLNKYLNQMNEQLEELGEEVSLEFDKKKVYLKIPYHFNLQHILIHYLNQSINCKIIMYLSKHDGFSIPRLCHELIISEATLFRRLKDINHLIAEFEIQIKNAKFIGDELQIRYFLFEFYNHTLPIDVINYHPLDPSIILLIENLSKELKLPIEEKNMYHLYLWLLISKRRELFGLTLEINQQDIYRKLIGERFTKAIEATNQELSSSVSPIQTETDLICLYIFFISTYIYEQPLSKDQYMYFFKNDFFRDIINLSENTLETIGKHFNLNYLSEELLWYIECNLFQLHFRLIHFNSYMSYFESSYLISKRMDDSISTIVNHVIYEHLSLFSLNLSPAVYDHIFLNYRFILQIIESECIKSISVGLANQVNYLAQQDILKKLETTFSKEFNVSFEIADRTKCYDLLVTDIFLTDTTYQYKEIYVINEILNAYDENMIREILIKLIQ